MIDFIDNLFYYSTLNDLNKKIYLGLFKNKQKAIEARVKASINYYGKFCGYGNICWNIIAGRSCIFGRSRRVFAAGVGV